MNVHAASPARAQAPARPVQPVAAKAVTKPAGGDHDGDGDDRGAAKVQASKLQTPKPGQKVNGAVYL